MRLPLISHNNIQFVEIPPSYSANSRSISNTKISIKIFISFIAILFLPLSANSQSIKKVKGEYLLNATTNISVTEAKRIATEHAKLDALEKEFGTNVIQASTTLISNNNGASNINSTTLGLSDIKAEWIETTKGPDCEISIQGDFIKIICKIEGKARETGHKIDFQTALLRNAPNLRHKSSEFIHGDDIFLYFKTPQSGYINVFVMDENTDKVYCLIPFHNSEEACEVQRDKDYIFFNNNEFGYVALTNQPEEFNDLIVVYSPTKINTPYMDERGTRNNVQNITCANFNKWLSKIRIQNPNVNVRIEPIKIRQ